MVCASQFVSSKQPLFSFLTMFDFFCGCQNIQGRLGSKQGQKLCNVSVLINVVHILYQHIKYGS